MVQKKRRATRLAVFKGREAKLNRAIFETLATKGPQTISNLQKQISKQKGLTGTYYASLSKRIRRLEETGYITQVKPTPAGSKAATYELRVKAYLAAFLNSTSMEDVIDQATDSKAAMILLALLNALSPDKD
jgi:DNA-binding transcriptional ArsR family regulator